MTALYEDRFISATLVDHPRALRRVVRVVRSPEAYSTMLDLERSYAPLYAAFAKLERDQLALLIDFRLVTPRNDPEFEATVVHHRARMVAGFHRVGVLVRSAVGKLQIIRHVREDGMSVLVSDNESELLDAIARDILPSRLPPPGR